MSCTHIPELSLFVPAPWPENAEGSLTPRTGVRGGCAKSPGDHQGTESGSNCWCLTQQHSAMCAHVQQDGRPLNREATTQLQRPQGRPLFQTMEEAHMLHACKIICRERGWARPRRPGWQSAVPMRRKQVGTSRTLPSLGVHSHLGPSGEAQAGLGGQSRGPGRGGCVARGASSGSAAGTQGGS